MAMTKWGRKETIIWPPHSPIYTYGAVFMAVVLTGLFLYCRFSFGNTSLQRFYTPIYIRSSVAAQSERAAETTTGCSWWVLAESHRVWRRTPT